MVGGRHVARGGAKAQNIQGQKMNEKCKKKNLLFDFKVAEIRLET